MKLKKLLALMLALVMVFALAACGNSGGSSDSGTAPADEPAAPAEDAAEPAAEPETAEEPAAPAGEAVDITLWTYPIGKWADGDTVGDLIAGFNAEYPEIHVSVEYLDYTNGDDQVNTAIEGGQAPDIIFEGPERLVANWGAKGLMVDLTDIWTANAEAEVYDAIKAACFNADGALYEYPLCMTAHCMAINKTVFEAADALQYVDLDSHTWTTEDFINAIAAVYAYTGETVGAVFCGGQGGDQGTRALVNNLYGGTFTNAEHTAYTADSPENIQALELLAGMDGIDFDASIVGGDEINLFRQNILKVAFCWNIAQQLNSDNAEAEHTNAGDEIVFMSFPSETGDSKLQGGIWGFGVFDNGDPARIDAAKKFITYMADSEEGTPDAVLASTYFTVRDSVNGYDLTGLYADNAIMNEYTKLMPYLGDYYQVTAGWAEARTAWWNMLQQIGTGTPVPDAVAEFTATANAAADAALAG